MLAARLKVLARHLSEVNHVLFKMNSFGILGLQETWITLDSLSGAILCPFFGCCNVLKQIIACFSC